jgi:hypothetical protein
MSSRSWLHFRKAVVINLRPMPASGFPDVNFLDSKRKWRLLPTVMNGRNAIVVESRLEEPTVFNLVLYYDCWCTYSTVYAYDFTPTVTSFVLCDLP